MYSVREGHYGFDWIVIQQQKMFDDFAFSSISSLLLDVETSWKLEDGVTGICWSFLYIYI